MPEKYTLCFGMQFSLELTSKRYALYMSCFSVVWALRKKHEFLETLKSRCKLADPSLASDALNLAIWWKHIGNLKTLCSRPARCPTDFLLTSLLAASSIPTNTPASTAPNLLASCTCCLKMCFWFQISVSDSFLRNHIMYGSLGVR